MEIQSELLISVSTYVFVHRIQSQMGSDVEVNPSCYYPSLDYCANSYTQALIVRTSNFFGEKKSFKLVIIAENQGLGVHQSKKGLYLW